MLEARGRVGGRVWSHRLENGAVVEMGAEFILPGNTWCGAGRPVGLGLWDKGMRYGQREPRGVTGSTRALERAVKEVDHELGRGMRERAESAKDPGGTRARSRGSRGAPGAGRGVGGELRRPGARARPRRHRAMSTRSQSQHRGRQPAPGGGARRGAPKLGSPRDAGPLGVLGREGVRVRADGGEVDADACVVAVPASVIGELGFDPALPARQSEARWRRTATGTRRSCSCRCDDAAAERGPVGPGALLDLDRDRRRRAHATCGQLLRRLAAALERLGVADGPERWLASLARLAPTSS